MSGSVAFSSLTAGTDRTCGRSASGLWCWGARHGTRNDVGAPETDWVPTADAEGFDFVDVDVASVATCGLDAEGVAWCWGEQMVGQAGLERSREPVQVSGDLRFASLEAGRRHMCGIELDGTAACWGFNYLGELGVGRQGRVEQPTPIAGEHTFVRLAAGADATCGLRETGEILCWGFNTWGIIGDWDEPCFPELSFSPPCASEPVQMFTSSDFVDLVATDHTMCGLTPTGVVECWGSMGWDTEVMWVPGMDAVAIKGAEVAFARIVSGFNHMCGLTRGGELYCWGLNEVGQVGPRNEDRVLTPMRVGPDRLFVDVAIGDRHSCAIASDGETLCWGQAWWGALGGGLPPGVAPSG